MMENYPLVSVIMAVYNTETYLIESVESILNQSYKNIEFIICDDCSTDKSFNILKEYKQKYPKILKIIKNNKNSGTHIALNKCLNEVRGKYVAIQDSDDISDEYRIEKQVTFLESNPQFSTVSCSMHYFDSKGIWKTSKPKKELVELDYLKGSPIAHGCSMTKRDAYEAVKGYRTDDKVRRVEDYDLWVRLFLSGFKAYNLSEDSLYYYRDDEAAFKRRKYKYRFYEYLLKYKVYKNFNISKKYFPYVVRPLIVGLVPKHLYLVYHRK